MHPSYFSILDSADEHSQNELTLSGEASEWLFHIKFWDKINDKYQTDFAQYEEESLSADIVEETVNSLSNIKVSLANSDNQEVNFCYGWNQNKEELICCVSSQVIADELGKLIALLEKAAKCNLDVYCQL